MNSQLMDGDKTYEFITHDVGAIPSQRLFRRFVGLAGDDACLMPNMAKTSWLIVSFGDAGGELAEALGHWSEIEG
jgi:hypothetical protein